MRMDHMPFRRFGRVISAARQSAKKVDSNIGRLKVLSGALFVKSALSSKQIKPDDCFAAQDSRMINRSEC